MSDRLNRRQFIGQCAHTVGSMSIVGLLLGTYARRSASTYGLVGKRSLVRMNAPERAACTDCGDCFRVCPEPHVITPALKPEQDTHTSVILHGDCTNCGRCIDVCDARVFRFSTRFG